MDTAFLGFGQIDQEGNVNVSKLDGVTVGPGGFIDIAQNARKVVFCGTFDAKGAKFETGHGQLSITRPGQIRKFVEKVDQITFQENRPVFRISRCFTSRNVPCSASGKGTGIDGNRPGH